MRRLLILTISLVMTACFDIHEELTIADGKGSISFTIWMDSSLASLVNIESIADSLRESDSRARVSLRKREGFTGITMSYTEVPIDSLSSIDTFLNIAQGNNTLRIKKILSIGKKDTTGTYILFSGRVYVFDLNTGRPILRSNATRIIADTFHRWIIPLDSLMKSGRIYRIEAEVEQ